MSIEQQRHPLLIRRPHDLDIARHVYVEVGRWMVENGAHVIDVHRVEHRLVAEPRIETIEVRDLAVVLEHSGVWSAIRDRLDRGRHPQVQCLTHGISSPSALALAVSRSVPDHIQYTM